MGAAGGGTGLAGGGGVDGRSRPFLRPSVCPCGGRRARGGVGAGSRPGHGDGGGRRSVALGPTVPGGGPATVPRGGW